MALKYADRVQETFTTTGTGTISLGGAITGYQAFSAALSNGDTCYYAATDGTNWEVGLGTYTSSGTTLARTTILASSNSNSAVSWAAGTKNIWLDLPAAAITAFLTTLSSFTNSLSGDVTMTNSGTYYDGPTVAQGTSGTWFASGTITISAGFGAHGDILDVKLWDGTTVIASLQSGQTSTATYNTLSYSLSGIITSPAANIKISAKNETSNGGVIKFNASGNSKDSTLTAFRIG